jgi:spore germination cell wall hydrolase CwlJ-like protein
MTKDKKIELTARILCILAALAFGAYLGAPVPKVWAQPVSEMMTAVSEQMTELSEQIKERETLHKQTGKDSTDEKTKAAQENTATEPGIEMIISEPPEEVQPDYIVSNANRGGAPDRKAKDVLIRLINAEAYGLSYKAKVAVGQVVMNRWNGPYYGDDLMAIMTAPHQFTPIYDGSAYQKQIEPDSIKAANAVLNGAGIKELTGDTYYFVNPDFTEDKTIEQKMTFVCEIEGIHFYKPPAK